MSKGLEANLSLVVVVVFRCLQSFEGASSKTASGELMEYCQWETFDAECSEDEVVVMTSALYGRMRIGRCIKQDRDDVGCSADVRGLADARCSGKQKCQITVPDKLFDGSMPCHEDLKLYLMASYQCLKVLQPRRNSCSNQMDKTSPDVEIARLNSISGNNSFTQKSGFISSWISSKTGCGSPQTPWMIAFNPGQHINLTLIDFASHVNSTIHGPDTLPGVMSPCQVIAVVKEMMPGKSKTVCSDPHKKERVIYVSEGHQVEVRIILPNIARDGGHFLIRFEAIGCEDLSIPERGWWQRSKVDPNLSTTGCFDTKKTWSLVCQANKWVGNHPRECPGSGSFFQSFASADFFIPNFAAIMVVVCIAFLVGAFIFLAGLCYIRKQRRILHTKKLQTIQDRCEPYTCKGDKLPQEVDFLPHGDCQFPQQQNFDVSEENDYAYVDELLQVHNAVPLNQQQQQQLQPDLPQQIPPPPVSNYKTPVQALKTCIEVEQTQYPKPQLVQQHYQQQYRSNNNNKCQDEEIVSSFPQIVHLSEVSQRKDYNSGPTIFKKC